MSQVFEDWAQDDLNAMTSPMASLGHQNAHISEAQKRAGQLGSFKLLSNPRGRCALLVTITITGKISLFFSPIAGRDKV